jgi:hypothetical protein
MIDAEYFHEFAEDPIHRNVRKRWKYEFASTYDDSGPPAKGKFHQARATVK